VPTCLPAILRRCHSCSSGRFRASGTFRVNAHHKLLDAWLLALCTTCGDTTKLTVVERMNVRVFPPELLDRLHRNDPGLVAELLQDPVVLRRNRLALDWDGAWRLDTGGSVAMGHGAIEISVHVPAGIPVRPVPLIAEGLGMSRAEVERLMAEGNLVSGVRLGGKRSSGFTFMLKR
jgi:hypothetical protein